MREQVAGRRGRRFVSSDDNDGGRMKRLTVDEGLRNDEECGESEGVFALEDTDGKAGLTGASG